MRFSLESDRILTRSYRIQDCTVLGLNLQFSYEGSATGDEDNAESYFRNTQEEELEVLTANEVNNALNCCSDNEYDTDQMDQN